MKKGEVWSRALAGATGQEVSRAKERKLIMWQMNMEEDEIVTLMYCMFIYVDGSGDR